MASVSHLRRLVLARMASPISLEDRLQLPFHPALAEESERIIWFQWVMVSAVDPPEGRHRAGMGKNVHHCEKVGIFVNFDPGR